MVTSKDIKQLARRAGFDLCGITGPEPIPEARARYSEWLNLGYQAEMNWMAEKVERRTDPNLLGLEARSIIMLGLNYYQPNSEEVPAGHGRVSRYARGRDYHKVAEGKIKKLLKLIQTRIPEARALRAKWWVDYGPFMERAYAAKAGLGFLAKNGMLISRQFGSWLFLAEIVTDLELEPDDPFLVNHGRCGTCRLCIDACPTGAIVSDGMVDSNKCISYLTVERPSVIPKALEKQMGLHPFGCDVCQDVCPHNNPKRSIPTTHEDFQYNKGVGEFLNLDRVLSMTTNDEFLELTAGTPLTRPKLEGLQVSAGIVKRNQRRKIGLGKLSRTYEASDIALAIEEIENAYAQRGLSVPRSSELGRNLAEAKAALSDVDAPVLDQDGRGCRFHPIVIGTTAVLRLASVIRWLGAKVGSDLHMQTLYKGMIDPTEPARTKAKDLLFELEMLENLKAAGLVAEVREPDLLFTFKGQRYSIACKCIYSERNIRKQLKKARDQVNKAGFSGIIALNISSLVDHSQFQMLQTEDQFDEVVSHTVRQFLQDNATGFRRCIAKSETESKVLGVLVAVFTVTRWEAEKRISFASKLAVDSLFAPQHPSTLLLHTVVGALQNRELG